MNFSLSRIKIIPGGITAPRGFLASGIHCGIKYKNKDLALIYSRIPSIACGLFTQNKLQAAPLKITRTHLKNNRAQAIVVNSGNANCCTGRAGMQDARKMCQVVARNLAINVNDVLVASTGIIGKRLPLEKIIRSAEFLTSKLSNQGGLQAAQAIMTTDTKPKQISVALRIGKTEVRIGGMAKGAGMIHPHLATMLAFITTDLAIDKKRLKKALQEAAERSFNLISVDGDTSTNDMLLVLTNGLAGNSKIGLKDFKLFQQALEFVCVSLAQMIIKDAEGANKFVEIKVEQAKNLRQAKRIAFKVANSPLVKTALYGESPNWGRIAACIGCADQGIRADKLTIYLAGIKVLQAGVAKRAGEQRLKKALKQTSIEIRIDLGLGKAATQVFTCDLSVKYVKINAEY